MKLTFRSLLFLAFGIILMSMSWMPGVSAQESSDSGTALDKDDNTSAEKPKMSEEELNTLMTTVDHFYIDQDMADLTVDVDVYRDPANRLNEEKIKDSNPGNFTGLCTIVSHYYYTFPGFYKLVIMGETLAGSELPTDQTFYSQLLPMPGAPIFTDSIRGRFNIRFEDMDEVDGTPVYRIRYAAKDREKEFFDYITYYIGVDRPRILRIQSAFDNVFYKGTAEGNFYYDKWLKKYLPIYGHGSVLLYPNRRYNLWGRWRNWNWRTADQVAESTGSTAQPEGAVN